MQTLIECFEIFYGEMLTVCALVNNLGWYVSWGYSGVCSITVNVGQWSSDYNLASNCMSRFLVIQAQIL